MSGIGPRRLAGWFAIFVFLALPAAAHALSGSVYVTNTGESTVSQYAIGGGGALSALTPPSIGSGETPSSVAVTPNGKSAYVTNLTEGTISQYDINPVTGVLSPKTPATVAGIPNPAGVAVSPDGKSAYVTSHILREEEGGVPELVGTVYQYDINPVTGVLSPKTPATIPTGFGPEGVVVSPDGKSAYVTNLTAEAVSQYDINPVTGVLSPKTPATVPAGFGPFGVAVSPDGKSAYVTNDGELTVSEYDINPVTGVLSPKTPATVPAGLASLGIAVSPDGKSAYVANQRTGTVSQYDIEPLTGVLSPKTPATVPAGAEPSGIAVSPDGKSAYVTDVGAGAVSQYDISPLTGTLSPKTPASIATGSEPFGIAVASPPSVVLNPTATSVSCTPSTVIAGQTSTCTAKVTDTAESGPTTPTGTVSFTSNGPGSFTGSGSCTLAGSGASASCSVSYTPSATTSTPVRPDTITAAYNGDSTHTTSKGTTSVKVLSITLLAHGSFVIGDQNATVGNPVTFWGSTWSSLNTLTGGAAPASFKGFASHVPNNPPQCEANWTSEPGNSSSPPATIPQYMAVIAASKITKSGSTISGNTVKVMIVKTNPGYAPDPGHPGTGTVVAQICPEEEGPTT
jgi:DNA-binding beta-propeller fold protein YncE